MGYIDGLINSGFKKIENGKSLFYPYGKFGYGYIVDSNTEIGIKQFLKHYYMFSFPIIVIFAILFKSFVFISLFIFIPIYLIRIKQILSISKKSEEKIKYKDVTRNMATSINMPTAFVIFLGSLVMLCVTIFNIVFLRHKELMDIAGVAFFGMCFLQSFFLVKYSKKK